MAAGVSWWRSFEAKVVALLMVVGLLCIGGSAYLLWLSTSYLDARVEASIGRAADLADVVRPFYRAQMQALAESYRARAQALDARARAEGWSVERWRAVLEETPDLAEVVVDAGGERRTLRAARPPGEDDVSFAATVPEGADEASARLVARFVVDPAHDRRFQAVGRVRRALRVEQRQLDAFQRAVVRAVLLLVGIVLVAALALGVVLARTVTRRVAVLAAAMDRIEREGEDRAIPDLGRDEVGRLAEALRGMLERLEAAQARVSYLERIGAWQGMARRIAHEIKNPLTPITLAVQQLRDKDPGTDPAFSKTLRTAVEIVEDEVGTLRRMVSTFSRFAKMPKVRAQSESLRRILSEFERAYGHLTDDERDRLEVGGPPEDLFVWVDRALLKLALVNLVENAVLSARGHAAGGVHVRLSVQPDPDPSFVRLLVDDNGPGVPLARRQAIFDPYETDRSDGTGLGLAIVKKVVLDHGGDVWVADGPLGGARFVVRLPRASGSDAGDQSDGSSNGER